MISIKSSLLASRNSPTQQACKHIKIFRFIASSTILTLFPCFLLEVGFLLPSIPMSTWDPKRL